MLLHVPLCMWLREERRQGSFSFHCHFQTIMTVELTSMFFYNFFSTHCVLPMPTSTSLKSLSISSFMTTLFSDGNFSVLLYNNLAVVFTMTTSSLWKFSASTPWLLLVSSLLLSLLPLLQCFYFPSGAIPTLAHQEFKVPFSIRTKILLFFSCFVFWNAYIMKFLYLKVLII